MNNASFKGWLRPSRFVFAQCRRSSLGPRLWPPPVTGARRRAWGEGGILARGHGAGGHACVDDASGWSTSRPVARVGRGEAPAVARPNTNAEAPRGVCSRDTRLDRVRVDDRDGRNASVPQLGCARQTRRSRGPRVRTRGNDETRIFQNAQARRCPRTSFHHSLSSLGRRLR